MRNPAWRKTDPDGALCVAPADAAKLGLIEGGRARVTTRRGSAVGSGEAKYQHAANTENAGE